MTQPGAPATNPIIAARLAHDVGKYIARTARNVARGQWTPDLVAMLCRDLYPAGQPLSARFVELAQAVGPWQGPHAVLQQVHDLLIEAEQRAAEVRRATADAVDRVAEIARQVEILLRAYARRMQKERP